MARNKAVLKAIITTCVTKLQGDSQKISPAHFKSEETDVQGAQVHAVEAKTMTRSSGERRRPVSAKILRRVLVEAGHRCAIPTCRHIEVDIHHIVPWAQRQSNEYNNLIALCPNCHRRADAGKIDRKSLRLYKVNLRFAHDKYSQLEIDVLFDLSKMPPDKGMPWLQYMLVLLKRLIDSGFISIHELSVGTFAEDIKTTPDLIAITNKGREFIDELGLHKL